MEMKTRRPAKAWRGFSGPLASGDACTVAEAAITSNQIFLIFFSDL
jgi:hypothetical protein